MKLKSIKLDLLLRDIEVDNMASYAPAANMNSIRVYLSACCHEGFQIHQIDVDTAFLNGHGYLEEKVYIQTPRGGQAQRNEVCHLNRSLYDFEAGSSNLV